MKKFLLLLIGIGILYLICTSGYASQKIYKLVQYEPLSQSECLKKKDFLGLSYCPYNNDHLAGAAFACGNINNLPSEKDLQALAQQIYNKKTSETTIYGRRNDKQLKNMGIFVYDSHIYYWTNKEANDGNGGYVRMFASKGSIPYYAPRDGSGYVSQAMGKINYGDTKYIKLRNIFKDSNFLSRLPNNDALVTVCYSDEHQKSNKYYFINENDDE